MSSENELLPEQVDRKSNSEAYCNAHGVKVIDHLPCIESIDTAEFRSHEAVVERALVLLYLGLKSEGLEQSILDKIEHDYGLAAAFSPNELAYIRSDAPTQQQKVDANWRYESLHVLLWALGYIDDLSFPSEMCDVASDTSFFSVNPEVRSLKNPL